MKLKNFVGITIRRGATENTLTTPDGQIFDLSHREIIPTAVEVVNDYLTHIGFFKKSKTKKKKQK